MSAPTSGLADPRAGNAPAPRDGRDATVLHGRWTYASITDRIAGSVLDDPWTWRWTLGFAITVAGTAVFFFAIGWLFIEGVGIWGINIPHAWGFAIGNFVWWIGIGHAGTFISAFLLLLRQKWRTSINRFAEAMTLFAAGTAGLFPILHLGRPWFFYWLVPYPDVMNVWPQWRSPLVWDFFAISAYIVVSLVFWYIGLVPDLASLRDEAKTRGRRVAYGLLALGWRGEARHWARYETAYLLLAGLATPLVVSVHSVVSLDFAIGIAPGYHSTIFPPFFVAGALLSGFAMVLTLAVPLRHVFRLQDFITEVHLDHAAKLMLVVSLIVSYSYATEAFMGLWSGSEHDIHMLHDRWLGTYAPLTWLMVTCNSVSPLAFFSRRVRRSPLALFALSIAINVGMWTERFVIVVQSMHRDFLASAAPIFLPTAWDWMTLFGSIAFFALLFLLFLRLLPLISIAEMRELVRERATGIEPKDPLSHEH